MNIFPLAGKLIKILMVISASKSLNLQWTMDKMKYHLCTLPSVFSGEKTKQKLQISRQLKELVELHLFHEHFKKSDYKWQLWRTAFKLFFWQLGCITVIYINACVWNIYIIWNLTCSSTYPPWQLELCTFAFWIYRWKDKGFCFKSLWFLGFFNSISRMDPNVLYSFIKILPKTN